MGASLKITFINFFSLLLFFIKWEVSLKVHHCSPAPFPPCLLHALNINISSDIEDIADFHCTFLKISRFCFKDYKTINFLGSNAPVNI